MDLKLSGKKWNHHLVMKIIKSQLTEKKYFAYLLGFSGKDDTQIKSPFYVEMDHAVWTVLILIRTVISKVGHNCCFIVGSDVNSVYNVHRLLSSLNIRKIHKSYPKEVFLSCFCCYNYKVS